MALVNHLGNLSSTFKVPKIIRRRERKVIEKISITKEPK